MSKILVASLSFLSAGIIFGFIVGRATSPDSSKRATGERFIALYAQWKRIDPEHGSLTLRVGNRVYAYSTGDSQVSTSYRSALEMANEPAPIMKFDQDVDKLTPLAIATPASGGILYAIASSVSERSLWVALRKEHGGAMFAAAAASLGGGALGYYLGHKSNPDYDNEVFQQTLHDQQLWSNIESDWRYLYKAAVLSKNPCAHAPAPEKPNRPGESPVQSADPGIEESQEQQQKKQEESFLINALAIHPEISEQVYSDPEIRACPKARRQH